MAPLDGTYFQISKKARWLFIDLGRIFTVSGLIFPKYNLAQIQPKYYNGTKNVTISGIPCQRWDEQWPHQHKNYGDEYFPDDTVGDSSNFCRNPTGFPCIWCYTKDPEIMMACCAIKVYNIRQDDRPFSKCYINDNKWTGQQFEALTCSYRPKYTETGAFVARLVREIDGQFINLVASHETDEERFHTITSNIQVLIKLTGLAKHRIRNSDLGMADGSISDKQITASTWQPNYEPKLARPFDSGWCAVVNDADPYIVVDMRSVAIIHGITVWNWEAVLENVTRGVFSRKFVPFGARELGISYSIENDDSVYSDSFNIAYFRNETKTSKLDRYRDIKEPQVIEFAEAVMARYITIRILQPLEPDLKCLRFEINGFRINESSDLPLLKYADFYTDADKITIGLVQRLVQASVISSIRYPSHYRGGQTYSWIIDFNSLNFIKLIFTNISLNLYEVLKENSLQECRDKISFTNGLKENEKYALAIDHTDNSRILSVETDVSYMTLTFKTCKPVSRLLLSGNGFRAIVTKQDTPSCFDVRHWNDETDGQSQQCTYPTMYLASESLLNLLALHFHQTWQIHMKKFTFHLSILDFYVRCDEDSTFIIKDRFTSERSFCNLNRPPKSIYTDSDTVAIEFRAQHRDFTQIYPVTERFRAKYITLADSESELKYSHMTNFFAIRKLNEFERGIASRWINTSFLAYMACSETFAKCYTIMAGTRISWKKAGEECWIRKKRLVSLHSQQEQYLIKHILRNFRYADTLTGKLETIFSHGDPDPYYYSHIGLSRVSMKPGAVGHLWENGSPMTFSAWNKREPSSVGHCTRMSFHLANYSDTWEAVDCEKGLANYFVCEQPITDALLNMSDTIPHQYNGKLNETVSGLNCQRWDSQKPHGHEMTNPDKYPDETVSDAQNYCRDPDGAGFIWCYTTDPNERWEKCVSRDFDEVMTHLYTGKLSTTDSGRTCQRWDSYTPHHHLLGDAIAIFPDETLEDAANYCRDPYMESSLWCYTTDPDMRHEPCIFYDTASDRCYSTHYAYTGTWNKTVGGKDCQRWDSNFPHEHEDFFGSQFPEGNVIQAENYCRDPYREGFLWCFTMDSAIVLEPCVVSYKFQISDLAPYDEHSKEFLCESGENIKYGKMCNGQPDCRDMSDERNCTWTVHPLYRSHTSSRVKLPVLDSLLFKCTSQEFISITSRCDGVIDCFDASDEANCSIYADGRECGSEQFQCDDGGCINVSQMCDFIVDCIDSSDENCDYPLCLSNEYHCLSGQCIPAEKKCDAYEQCLDGSDENICDICGNEAFHCDAIRCIPDRLVCDKYPDCKDGSDEEGCKQPIFLSCEELLLFGYRTNGIYSLNGTDAECSFEHVDTGGKIYTVFYNIEVTKQYNSLVIHSKELGADGFDYGMFNILTDNKQKCTQNVKGLHSILQVVTRNNGSEYPITQSCIAAHKAAADFDDPKHEHAFAHCKCVQMTVVPFGTDGYIKSIQSCDDDTILNTTTRFLFVYNEEMSTRFLTLRETDFSDIEIIVGPIVCIQDTSVTHKEETVGCGDENKIFPGSIRCVYNTDAAGFAIGCRSGTHLHGCENFNCPSNTTKCPGSFCMPLKFICDGIMQCPNGQDELDCGCKEENTEVLVLYEENVDIFTNRELRSLSKQFYAKKSVFRVLGYKSRTQPDKLKFKHRLLDITDKETYPFDIVDRDFICKYSKLASMFINDIQFSKNKSKAIIYIQSSNESEIVAQMIFGNIKAKPDFEIYRITQEPNKQSVQRKQLPFVNDVSVSRWALLSSTASTLFPSLCKGTSKVYCPNEYKCASSKTCIAIEDVCDGYAQCLYGDDERLCNYACPENCTCTGYAVDCSFSHFKTDSLMNLHSNSRSVDLTGNAELKDMFRVSELNYPRLIRLYLSACKIDELVPNVFRYLNNLRYLDLSNNNIVKIPKSAFIGLRRLVTINLHGNTALSLLESYALQGLLSLKILNITGSSIKRISSNAFAGLNLDLLNLSNNRILQLEDFAFRDLQTKHINIERTIITYFNQDAFTGIFGLKSLRTPEYKFCCVRPNYLSEDDCFPRKDEFSSCDDLMRIPALQTMLWLMGVCALLGNLMSVIYRFVYDRERLKLGFGIFVTNLAVADFLMGVYLIIIAIADAAFRKRYIFKDDYWRNSGWCTLAGIVSTVSSEASVFFLCLITLDRFLVIKYPFSQLCFNQKNALISSIVVWTVSMSIAIFPLLHKEYFKEMFYTKSGVCIALPLTRDRPPGWLYSVVIFIGVNFVTFILIAVGQLSIYKEIKNITSVVKGTRTGKSSTNERRVTELTVARNLLLVVTTDFLCWFPIGCMGIMAMTGHMIPGEVYAWTAVFVLPINSALNPILYTLTAVLSRKNRKRRKEQSFQRSDTAYQLQTYQPIKGLFRYFITKRDNDGQSFISLEAMCYKDVAITRTVIIKILLQISKCLRFLHRNSYVLVKLDAQTVYVSVEYEQVVGDIQIRQEPSPCFNSERKSEDIYKLGILIRSLLPKLCDSNL